MNIAVTHYIMKIRAIKSFGILVHVTPDNFLKIITNNENLLVIESVGGFFSTKYYYLTSYKGLAFFTKSEKQLTLPSHIEIIKSNKIEIP